VFNKRFWLFLFVIFCLVSSDVLAAENLGKAHYSLDEALKTAYFSNPGMRSAREAVEAQKGRAVTQSSFRGPEVRFEVGGFKSQEVDGEKVDPKKSLSSWEVTQEFDAPGTLILKSQIADNQVKIKENELKAVWADIYKRVKSAYAGVLFSEEALRVFEANLNSARQFRDAVEVQYQSGKAPRSKSIRSNIEVLKSEAEYLEAQKNLKKESLNLNLLLGRPADSEFQLTEMLSYEALEIRHEEYLDKALKTRPEIIGQELRLKAAGKDLVRSRLSILPEPFVGLSRTREDYDNDYSILLGAKLPLWDFNFGEIKEKVAVRAEEEIRLESLQREVESQVRESILETELASKRVELQKKALQGVDELLKEAVIQFQEGELSFLEFLENLKTSKETRLAYFESLKNYYEKTAELEQAVWIVPTFEGGNKK